MAQISCVVIFIDRPQFTFMEVAAAVQKNFKEFENTDPGQLNLGVNQTSDNIPDDIPIYLFHSDECEIQLARGRFAFVKQIDDKQLKETYCNEIEEMLNNITEVFASVAKFENLRYRLGIVVDGNFLEKEVAQRSLQKFMGDGCELVRHDEIEVSVNDNRTVQEFIVNSWKRIYINESGNSFLFDINNHISTPANNRNMKINELYNKVIKDELEVVMNDTF